jgi:hypothetical protein
MAHCRAENDYDRELANQKVQSAQLLMEWRKQDGKHDDETRDQLIQAAVLSEQPEIVEEVAAGGDVASMEIKLPSGELKIQAKIIRNLGEIPSIPYGDKMDCVIRRMTKTRFEAWTPKHGWLFDPAGDVVNEARPPRRDGIGREWHGAFLPDGRWITTDLWEMDKTLYFFSYAGKCLKERKVADLAPPSTDDALGSLNLIGWARCDKLGKGWVVSVGDGPGRGWVFVSPQGTVRQLEEADAPWKLCFPRDLEPKGMYTSLRKPDDDFKREITFDRPGHGAWCDTPTYSWHESTDSRKVIPGGDSNFGFLPGSHNVFIGASDYDTGNVEKERALKTWFFEESGKCLGWIRAAYLADSADQRATWYFDAEYCVVPLGAGLKPQTPMRFVIEGVNARPVKLFTDLRLGFFYTGRKLVLARW